MEANKWSKGTLYVITANLNIYLTLTSYPSFSKNICNSGGDSPKNLKMYPHKIQV